MTDIELLKNTRRAYDKRKAELYKDLHDYNYWELYMGYELCEWLETLINEYAEDNRTLLDYLKTKANPFEWLMEVMTDREDDMWDNIGMAMDYQMRWEKEHEINN